MNLIKPSKNGYALDELYNFTSFTLGTWIVSYSFVQLTSARTKRSAFTYWFEPKLLPAWQASTLTKNQYKKYSAARLKRLPEYRFFSTNVQKNEMINWTKKWALALLAFEVADIEVCSRLKLGLKYWIVCRLSTLIFIITRSCSSVQPLPAVKSNKAMKPV